MATQANTSPKQYLGVTVSSTFTDLQEHRAALIKAINEHGMHPVAMEHDSAKVVDVIDSSLQMVRDGAAYVGVISKKYGQIPKCPLRNPDNLSITELEFGEALRLGRPILLFIMGKDHLVHEEDIETNAGKKKKLKAFTERAKRMKEDSTVHRVWASFSSLADFKDKVGPALAELRRHLDSQATDKATIPEPDPPREEPIPEPPSLYAEPPYTGLHHFIGRHFQLQELSDWARAADPHTVLLFEAIGGNGKSMLTWEWTNHHATRVRPDWAGRFWYSFYEKGAVMADFCQRAVAYMTRRPLEELRKKKTPELAKQLLRQLNDRPWLLILDGLERVLVAYHRIDAAEVPDEEANRPTDKIVNRNPCSAIRDEDEDLIRSLAAARPSKILVSSRLTPRVLLNPASQPIPGVRRVELPGLRPPDAEELLRTCGITGSSRAIQDYLTTNCDCHPLVIGALAGLINDYLPDKGNFDGWANDPNGGGRLNLGSLDLIQRRNHILRAALGALPEKSMQLLATLALLAESIDYQMLSALNPHLPPEPEKVEVPMSPEGSWWDRMPEGEKSEVREAYEAALLRRQEYEQRLKAHLESEAFRTADRKLADTVRDLQQRGLLQYDGRTKRYDLHPVVRGVAAGGLKEEDKARYGERVVDYFSRQSHNPYNNAVTLEDVRNGLNLVRALLKMGRFQEAYTAYRGDLANALLFNLEAFAEVLSLLRPFFAGGWGTLPGGVGNSAQSTLANDAGFALQHIGEPNAALVAYAAAVFNNIQYEDWAALATNLINLSEPLLTLNRTACEDRCLDMALALAMTEFYEGILFRARLERFRQLADGGRWREAEEVWQMLDPMDRPTYRGYYLPGDAEYQKARFQYWRGELREEHLVKAETLAKAGLNRLGTRLIYGLRGRWRLDQEEWSLARGDFHEAVRLARETQISDSESETGLALAKFHLGELNQPALEAEQLAQVRKPAHHLLALLWLAIGNFDQAITHALAAYHWAWADGEPYVHRYELTQSAALLRQLRIPVPDLPPYDPAKDEKFAWEDAVAAAVEKLRAEKKTK